MKKLLNEIVEILEIINSKSLEKKIKEDVFKEQYENLKKFQETSEELILQIKDLKKSNLKNKALIDEKLVYLLLNLSTIIWCFDQLDDLIRLVIQKIPDN